ncbi:MAG: LysM peptidoglycan-binding domain-containing protein [Bacteroidales bacterium]|nr:LysM peptidoglycan-binding domain-containing protein [Bacteroidales bacterium]
MQYPKIYLLIFLLIGILFGGCKQLENISKRAEKPKLKKEQLTTLAVEQEKFVLDDLSQDEVIDTLIQPSADSLSEVNQAFDTLAFASYFGNKFSSQDTLSEDLSLMTGSAILQQLDSLAALKIFDRYFFQKDTAVLNVYHFKPEERPVYSDSVYALRIAVLNSQTPIDLEYNKHVKGYINMYAGKGRNQTARMLGLAEIYFPLFETALDKYNIPLEIKYLAIVESALNPTAGSRVGAKGLWQFMYATGKMYGLNQTSMVDDRFDPYKATEAACKYLLDLYAIYHDWNLVLAAYNSGPGNVNRAIRRAGGLKNYWAIWPFLPRETRGYIPAFIAVNYIFNYAAEHNIFPEDPGILSNQIDSITVHDVISFDQIAEFMHLPIEDVRFLNPAYKEGIIPAVNGQKYVLRLPRQHINYFIDHEDSLYAFKSKRGVEREKLMAKIKEAKQRSIHIVRSGENLGLIAQKYRTSVSRLKGWNGLRNSRIYPGQKLIVYNPRNASRTSTFVKKNTSSSTYHQVRSGENLGLIAKKHGISISQIRAWNNINGNLIQPGQRLRVKARKQKAQVVSKNSNTKVIYHTVRKGDTLWDIAKEYNSTVNSIRELNKLGSTSKLKPGQKLKVQDRS